MRTFLPCGEIAGMHAPHTRLHGSLFLLVAISLGGCAHNCTFVPLTRGVKAQPPYCGVSALGDVLAFHHHETDRAALTKRVHLAALNGTIPDLLVAAATEHGMSAQSLRAELLDLHKWLSLGLPPIIYLPPNDTGQSDARGHLAVLTGLCPRKARMLSYGRTHWMPLASFTNRWKRGGCLAVLIQPQE